MIEKIPIESREQWLAMRLIDVTASDAAAVNGAHPRKTPLQVYAEKKGLATSDADSNIMRRGRWLEPAFPAALADECPTWQVRRANVYLRDPIARIGATPDMVAIDPEREGLAVIQCKIVSRPIFRRQWLGEDEETVTAPLHYQIQTLTEAMLAEASWAAIAALVIDTYTCDLHIVPVELNAAAWDRIRGNVANFWAAFDAGIPPAADYALDGDLLRELYPADDGTRIDLTTDNAAPILVADLERARADARDAKGREDAAKAGIIEKMGSARYGLLADGRRISFATIASKGYVVEPRTYRQIKILNGRAHP